MYLEKLAIALAMISTPIESSVVLTKNLRVCSDCHEMAKRLSRLRKREIVIREYRSHRDQMLILFSFLLQEIHFDIISSTMVNVHAGIFFDFDFC
jgi:hypothetical protein